MTLYRDYQPQLAPRWLQQPNGTLWNAASGIVKDWITGLAKDAIAARLPEYAPTDAVEKIGLERGLPRGPDESLESYAARVTLAWDDWQFAGTAFGLLVALKRAGYGSNSLRYRDQAVTLRDGLGNSHTVVSLVITGSNGTVVPAGSIVSNVAGTIRYSTKASATITVGGVWTAAFAYVVGDRLAAPATGTVSGSAWRIWTVIAAGTASTAPPVAQSSGTHTDGSLVLQFCGEGIASAVVTAESEYSGDFSVAADTLKVAVSPPVGVGTWRGVNNAFASVYEPAEHYLEVVPVAWQVDPIFWNYFDVLFPYPWAWGGETPPADGTPIAEAVKAIIETWRPAHAKLNRAILYRSGYLWGHPARTWTGNAARTWGAATVVGYWEPNEPPAASTPAVPTFQAYSLAAHYRYIYDCQKDSGAITQTSSSTLIEPNFATIACFAMIDHDPEFCMRWIEWYRTHQQPDGIMNRWDHNNGTGVETNLLYRDSDDAYAADMIDLVHQYAVQTGSLVWVREHWATIQKWATVVDRCTDADGLTFALVPEAGVSHKYAQDNTSVWRGWNALAGLCDLIGDTSGAATARAKRDRTWTAFWATYPTTVQTTAVNGQIVPIGSLRSYIAHTINPAYFYADSVTQWFPLAQEMTDDSAGYWRFVAWRPNWHLLAEPTIDNLGNPVTNLFPWMMLLWAAARAGDVERVKAAHELSVTKWPALVWPWFIIESAWTIRALKHLDLA